MPERIRVVGMVGEVPVAPAEGDLVSGGHRHRIALAPARPRAVEGDEVITRAERIRVVGMVGDVPAAPIEGDLVIGGHRHLAAVVPSVADIVALEHKVVTGA